MGEMAEIHCRVGGSNSDVSRGEYLSDKMCETYGERGRGSHTVRGIEKVEYITRLKHSYL